MFAEADLDQAEVDEIRRLTEISAPTIGLITNVTACHLEKANTYWKQGRG